MRSALPAGAVAIRTSGRPWNAHRLRPGHRCGNLAFCVARSGRDVACLVETIDDSPPEAENPMPDMSMDEAASYLGHIVDDGQNIVGTGFQVAPGLLITALHVVGPLALQDPESEVQLVPFGGNQPQRAVIQAAAGDLDLALLRYEEPFTGASSGFALTRAVDPGTRVEVVVASSAGQLARVNAMWRGTRSSPGGVRQGQLLTPELERAPGMSGGPVVRSRDGLVVGVLLGVSHSRRPGPGSNSAWRWARTSRSSSRIMGAKRSLRHPAGHACCTRWA